MDDSDQDFVELCSKPLKRVRKKPVESRPPRKADYQPCTQDSEGDKRRRNNRRNGDNGCKATGSQSVCTGASQHMVNGGTVCSAGDAGSLAVLSAAAAAAPGPGPRAERGLTAKDKVLNRMQQFKRASPQRMVHRLNTQPTQHKDHSEPLSEPQRQEPPEPSTSGLHLDSDEALAVRLQQELDREVGQAETVDLEDGGLFFCQICHKDMSHMTPEGRTQHLNRCLDESEESAPAPPPPPPGVPDCPICGKRFKSQKSRSAHLKRCSSDMGVSPAVLRQVLQRQAEESQAVPTGNTLAQTGGVKRKGPSKPGNPAKKKPRKKPDPLDEDTMVALALSSSLLEQEKEVEIELQTETAVSHSSLVPALKWRTDAGMGRGKKKKGAAPRPPPLLIVQDAQEALMRLQERVSALLLRSRSPSPPTPTRCPSSLRGWSGAAPLWQKSTLLNGSSTCLSDFYTPELKEFITPWESAMTNAVSSNAGSKPNSSIQPVSEGTPITETRASILPSSSQTAATPSASSTPGTAQAPVGSQALRDLMELAEDGMTLTQCGYSTSGTDKNKQSSASQSTNLHLSGFVLEEAEEQADLCVSGFLPETAHTLSADTHRKTAQPRADEEQGSHRTVALSRLASDLSSMVNNPQLSDLQLQVDSGEVYFAHSFMVYARCPLLAEMVHESGFRVQEADMPAAQRVLMSDVPGQAVFTLLQYLYTAHCSIPASLQPHVLELASRFDLQELQQLCELHQEETDHMNQEENVNNQTDQAFMELLRSMWNEEDEEEEGTDADGGTDEERRLEEDHKISDIASGEREICEEQVNEEELEEIYEFAATQRKREEEKDSVEEEEEEKEDDGDGVFTKLTEPTRRLSEKNSKLNSQPEPDPGLDRSYSRLFSCSWGVYEEEEPPASPSNSGPPKTHTPQSQKHQSLHKPALELSGRTLLLSSPSVVDDLSASPPPSTSNLPITGLSPGQVSDCGGGGDSGPDAFKLDVPEKCLSLKRESQGRRSISFPVSPASPVKKKEPELIVLSDSSEEMEVDVALLSSRSPSTPSSCTIQNLQRFTHIKPHSIPKTTPSTTENKRAASGQSRQGSGCDQSPVDCSPEVSWLIPSTPVQPERCLRTSSTQTKRSMCRMQLFPKGDISSPSSPARQLHNRPETSTSATRVSAHIDPTEGSVPRFKMDESVPCSSSTDRSSSPKRISLYDVSENRDVFAVPQNRHKLSHRSNSTHEHPLEASLKQDTPLHIQHPHPQPCSSTPLHTELHQPLIPLADSPLIDSKHDQQRWTSKERDRSPSESPDKTELGSFHLSPLSDPLDPPSSSSCRGLQSSQRDGKSCSESQHSVDYSNHNNTGAEAKRSGTRNKEEERETECETKDMCDEEEQEEGKGEADVSEHSFQQSFMDEPPIAFSDSWDACIAGNAGCFSLRLEDSGGSNQHERSETSRSSSSAERPPPPPSGVTHVTQSLNSCGSATNSSPAKAHSTQPSTSVQAPTPPAPDHNSLLESKLWDSWEEEEEEVLPLSQRLNPSAQLTTPKSSYIKKRRSLVSITPMPQYSDMDTPELKNKLNRFGVRPLPKRQMILKLKEIHQYTHQLVSSSDSEDEAASARRTAQMKPTSSAAAGSRPVSCAQTVKFKEPRAPAAISPLKHKGEEEEGELLSASQGSNTSSTAASEESERSNPELCLSSDGNSDSDGGISASQAANRLQDRLQAVRSFILSDPRLYNQILQYQPLVLSQLQERLKAAGIRLGAAKLVDYLDSQCITFTTAKPGQPAPSRKRGHRTGRGAKAAGEKRAYKKKAVTVML